MRSCANCRVTSGPSWRGEESRRQRARDASLQAEIAPLWQAYLARAAPQRQSGVSDAALEEFRWLLEELRVSLFAQPLKTAVPVSPLPFMWGVPVSPLLLCKLCSVLMVNYYSLL